MKKTPGNSDQLPLRFEPSGFGELPDSPCASNVLAFAVWSKRRVLKSDAPKRAQSEAEIIQSVLTQAKKISW